MIKTCPRCGTSFECRAEEIADCKCAALKLTPRQLREIQVRYSDCLCACCLDAIAADQGTPQDLWVKADPRQIDKARK